MSTSNTPPIHDVEVEKCGKKKKKGLLMWGLIIAVAVAAGWYGWGFFTSNTPVASKSVSTTEEVQSDGMVKTTTQVTSSTTESSEEPAPKPPTIEQLLGALLQQQADVLTKVQELEVSLVKRDLEIADLKKTVEEKTYPLTDEDVQRIWSSLIAVGEGESLTPFQIIESAVTAGAFSPKGMGKPIGPQITDDGTVVAGIIEEAPAEVAEGKKEE